MPPPSCAFHLWTWATLDLASEVCTVLSKKNRLGMVILLSFSPFPRRHPLCRWHFRQGLGSDKSSYVEIYHYQSFSFTSFAIWFIFNTKEWPCTLTDDSCLLLLTDGSLDAHLRACIQGPNCNEETGCVILTSNVLMKVAQNFVSTIGECSHTQSLSHSSSSREDRTYQKT